MIQDIHKEYKILTSLEKYREVAFGRWEYCGISERCKADIVWEYQKAKYFITQNGRKKGLSQQNSGGLQDQGTEKGEGWLNKETWKSWSIQKADTAFVPQAKLKE